MWELFEFSLRAWNGPQAEQVASAIIILTVVFPPTWTNKNIDLGTTLVGQVSWTFDLKTQVSNPGNEKLTFAITSGKPGWMNLDPSTGILSGVPALGDLGPYSDIQLTVTGQSGGDTATAHGLVASPPKWTNKNIDLGTTLVGQVGWTFDLKTQVSNPGNETSNT